MVFLIVCNEHYVIACHTLTLINPVLWLRQWRILSVDMIEKSLNASQLPESKNKTVSALTPRDCYEIYISGERSDGVYTVYVGTTRRPVEVYCDMTTDGGG